MILTCFRTVAHESVISGTGMTSLLKVMQMWSVIHLAFVDQPLQCVFLLPNEYQNAQAAVWAYLFITQKSCVLGLVFYSIFIGELAQVIWYLNLQITEIRGCIVRKGSEQLPHRMT